MPEANAYEKGQKPPPSLFCSASRSRLHAAGRSSALSVWSTLYKHRVKLWDHGGCVHCCDVASLCPDAIALGVVALIVVLVDDHRHRQHRRRIDAGGHLHLVGVDITERLLPAAHTSNFVAHARVEGVGAAREGAYSTWCSLLTAVVDRREGVRGHMRWRVALYGLGKGLAGQWKEVAAGVGQADLRP